MASRSAWASTLYYTFASSAFRREHQAVLAGRIRYHEQEMAGESTRYLLRRNVHRIEKGLIMRPRRAVFAADYVGETAVAFCQQVAGNNGDAATSEEMEWAGDVLRTYFDVAGPHPSIDQARLRFRAAGSGAGNSERTPYLRDIADAPSVRYDDLRALARRRRSVRWFEQKPVPRGLIDQALHVAAQAPSACNRQPYTFRIFDDSERVRRVAEIPMGTTGFSHNIPTIAVLVGEQSAYFSERDRHVIYIDASLAAMSFLLALESLGLSSCCLNWPDIEIRERAMAAELGLRPHERVIMLIAIGYPDPEGMVPYSQKRAIEEIRTYNR